MARVAAIRVIPKLIETEVESKQQNLKIAGELVPQLKSLHNVSDRPQVRFYEGKEGLEQVYEDTLTSHETIRAYANVNVMHAALPEYFVKYYKRSADKRYIHIRAIIPANEAGTDRASKDKEEARKPCWFYPRINIIFLRK